MKRFCSFSSMAGNTRNNPQVFPASTSEKATFPCFFTFEILDSSVSKDIQANPCRFIPGNKKGSVNKYVRFH